MLLNDCVDYLMTDKKTIGSSVFRHSPLFVSIVLKMVVDILLFFNEMLFPQTYQIRAHWFCVNRSRAGFVRVWSGIPLFPCPILEMVNIFFCFLTFLCWVVDISLLIAEVHYIILFANKHLLSFRVQNVFPPPDRSPWLSGRKKVHCFLREMCLQLSHSKTPKSSRVAF